MADKTGTGQPIGTVLSPRQESFVLDCISSTTATTIGRFVQITSIIQSGQAWKAQVDQVTAVLARASKPILGVALNTTGTTAVAIAVCVRGLVVAEAGASIAVGSWCGSDSVGRTVALTLGAVSGASTASAVDATTPSVEGYTGVGILVLQNGTAAAGDGVGLYIR